MRDLAVPWASRASRDQLRVPGSSERATRSKPLVPRSPLKGALREETSAFSSVLEPNSRGGGARSRSAPARWAPLGRRRGAPPPLPLSHLQCSSAACALPLSHVPLPSRSTLRGTGSSTALAELPSSRLGTDYVHSPGWRFVHHSTSHCRLSKTPAPPDLITAHAELPSSRLGTNWIRVEVRPPLDAAPRIGQDICAFLTSCLP